MGSHELGAIYKLMATADPTRTMVCPRGSDEEVKRTWEDFWEAVGLVGAAP